MTKTASPEVEWSSCRWWPTKEQAAAHARSYVRENPEYSARTKPWLNGHFVQVRKAVS